MDVNASSKKHLAPSAGFIKFCPRPPNTILTTTIAKNPPTTPIHQGALGGRFNANNSPVTTAEKSVIVFFLCTSRSNRYSKRTQLAMVTKIKTSACNPKLYIPKIVVGINAATTQSMMMLVDILERICGLDDTFIKSLMFSLPPAISFSGQPGPSCAWT